jgi:hypothetical protein
MVMESGSAPTGGASQLSERPKEASTDANTEIRTDRPRGLTRRPQPDLAGFIGADLWMVGKYER